MALRTSSPKYSSMVFQRHRPLYSRWRMASVDFFSHSFLRQSVKLPVNDSTCRDKKPSHDAPMCPPLQSCVPVGGPRSDLAVPQAWTGQPFFLSPGHCMFAESVSIFSLTHAFSKPRSNGWVSAPRLAPAQPDIAGLHWATWQSRRRCR